MTIIPSLKTYKAGQYYTENDHKTRQYHCNRPQNTIISLRTGRKPRTKTYKKYTECVGLGFNVLQVCAHYLLALLLRRAGPHFRLGVPLPKLRARGTQAPVRANLTSENQIKTVLHMSYKIHFEL